MCASTTDFASAEHRLRRPDRLATCCSAGLIILAGVAAYANSFQGQFVFDDELAILENASIQHLWPMGPVLWSATNATVIGRPLLNLSLAINYAWGGTDVWGYHAVNLTLHLLAALTLFGVIRRTLLLPRMSEQIARDATGIALVATLLWTVHPLQTESVTYIVQRAESLVGLFCLLTFYCVIRGATGHHSAGWYVAAVAACFLGMASKEVMVSAPLLLLVYDRIFLADSFREVLRRRWRLYAGVATAWMLLAVLMISSGGRGNTAGLDRGMSAWDYAMTQYGAIVGYLGLCFWPDPLVLDYGADVARTSAEILPYALIVSLLLAGTVWALCVKPAVGFLGFCFFIILAPSSSVIPLITQTIAEHRMYLPLASIALLAVLAGREVWKHLLRASIGSEYRAGVVRWAVPAIAAFTICGAFGYQTYLRNIDYHSVLRIWEDNARKRPGNPRSFYSVAAQLAKKGDLTGAIQQCNIAIGLDPNSFTAYLNRANVYALLKDYQHAMQDYARVLEIHPGYFIAYYNRGNVLAFAGRTDEALRDFTTGIEMFPKYTACYFERARLYASLGRDDEALADFSKVIELAPDQAGVYMLRGRCHYKLGQFDQAWADIRTSEKLGGRPDPEFIKLLTEASALRLSPLAP